MKWRKSGKKIMLYIEYARVYIFNSEVNVSIINDRAENMMKVKMKPKHIDKDDRHKNIFVFIFSSFVFFFFFFFSSLSLSLSLSLFHLFLFLYLFSSMFSYSQRLHFLRCVLHNVVFADDVLFRFCGSI